MNLKLGNVKFHIILLRICIVYYGARVLLQKPTVMELNMSTKEQYPKNISFLEVRAICSLLI